MKRINFLFFISCSFFIIANVNAQTVIPEQNDDIYSLTFKNIKLSIDSKGGAKVSSLTINGDEFLVTKSGEDDYLYGSTAWPAPQSEFGWPPPMDLDDGEYTGSISDNVITLTSLIDTDGEGNEMQFIKSFWADNIDTSITIRYTLVNKGNSNITKAVWELTRPPVNGITFWPTGPGGDWGDLSSSIVEQDNYSWIDIGNESRRNLKFFADGADGWFAHVDSDNRLFIKTFENVNQNDFANNEAELELWIAENYIELENIGAAKTLAPEESVIFEVKWYLRELSASITPSVGNNDLIAAVNRIINLPSVGNSEESQIALGVYPNPTKNAISFNFSSNDYENVTLILIDAIGKIQLNAKIENNKEIDISCLKDGIYFYSLTCNNISQTGKIIKE